MSRAGEELALVARSEAKGRARAPVVDASAVRRPDGTAGAASIERRMPPPEPEEEDAKSSEPAPVTRSRGLPWVDVRRIPPPAEAEAPQADEVKLPPWGLFAEGSRIDWPDRPAVAVDRSLLPVPPPRRSGLSRTFERLVRKKAYSEVRRFIKRRWKKHFRATPTMSYARYIEGIESINRLGREPSEFDHGSGEHLTNEFKEDLFGRTRREGEADFEIFAWGPLVVMDSGSVHFDLGRAFHADLDEVRVPEDDGPSEVDSILSTRDYRVGTSLRLGFDPLKAMKDADPTWAIDRYGVAVEVAWLSDVLGRETLATEIEAEWERNGEFAAFVNFVFKSRD